MYWRLGGLQERLQREAANEKLRRQREAKATEARQRKIYENEVERREQLSKRFDDPVLGPILRRACLEELDRLRG